MSRSPASRVTLYVMPPRLFSTDRGISLAEFEFPAYFNFFLKQRSIRVICRREQRAVLETVFREALFGPSDLDPEEFAGFELRRFLRNNPGVYLQLLDLVEPWKIAAGGPGGSRQAA